MSLTRGGRLRKRWRYLAVFDERVMLCAARAEVGPMRQSFWALWDREGQRRYAHTSFLRGAGAVAIEPGLDSAGPVSLRLRAGEVSADLRFAESEPIESLCPSGGSYAWTRKRAGMAVTGMLSAGGRSWQLEGARGVDDLSAGYHQRHTDWMWSAGVGSATDGRALAWNLVSGINDPPSASERAIWVDGEPAEPAPVRFEGTEAIEFAGGARIEFAAESERARDDNLLILRSRYRHLFGTFSGSLDGIPLERGLGVMEEHSALW
jgi:hypothetical protein